MKKYEEMNVNVTGKKEKKDEWKEEKGEAKKRKKGKEIKNNHENV